MARYEFSLQIEGPDDFRAEIEVPEGFTKIGRQAGNDLVLPHTQVSRNHARIDASGDAANLTDLGSSNGSYINGEKLEPNTPVRLKDGDRIKIGPFQITVSAREIVVETKEHEAPVPDPSIVSEVAPAPEEPEAERAEEPAEKPAAAVAEGQEEPVEAAEEEPAGASKAEKPGSEAEGAPPAPPAGPPPLGPVAVNGHPGAVPGLTLHSSVLLDYLPGIYHSDFMSRLLGLFEATLLPIEWTIDNFDQFLDPDTSPAGFLPWLSSWYGLVFDSTWTEAQRRQLLGEAHAIFARRGTRGALSRVLEIYTGVEPEIDDEAEDLDPFTFSVVIHRRKRDVRPDLIEALIDAHKPAHTTYKLRFKG